VATSGFAGAGFAEEIAGKLEENFLATGKPRNLTLVYAAGQGDGLEKGLNHMGHEGLVRRVGGGHIGLAPKLQKLIRENKILAYNFPQGVISHLFRDIAAHKVGSITTVGMGTYIDPRNDGGKLNELTKKPIFCEFRGVLYQEPRADPKDQIPGGEGFGAPGPEGVHLCQLRQLQHPSRAGG
jgi:propionate CoA-transferase